MKKRFYISLLPVVALLISLVACSTKRASDSNAHHKVEWKHYACDWFDFDYPSYFKIEKERNEISDTIPGLKAGGEVNLYCDFLPIRFRFVKSSMFDVFDNPEAWRDFSIDSKNYGESDKSGGEVSYLGVFETMDSLTFKGNPAASVLYGVLEGRDTVAHYQLVVLTKPTNDLYYLNYIAPISSYDDYWETADSIFNSINF